MNTLQEKKLDFYNYVNHSTVLASEVQKDLGLSISEIHAFALEDGYRITPLHMIYEEDYAINGSFVDYVYQQCRGAHKFPADPRHFSATGEISRELVKVLHTTVQNKKKIDSLLFSSQSLEHSDFSELLSEIMFICSDEQQTHCVAFSNALSAYLENQTEKNAEAVAQEWDALCNFIDKLVTFFTKGKFYKLKNLG